MKDLLSKFSDSITLPLLAFAVGCVSMLFYLTYPMVGYLPQDVREWDVLATTLSRPDLPAQYRADLNRNIPNSRLRTLTNLRIALKKAFVFDRLGYPQFTGILWMSLVVTCLAGIMLMLGVKVYLVILFGALWITLPGVWQAATQGSSDCWVVAFYALAALGISFNSKESPSTYWFVKIYSGILVGLLIALGVEGWILLLAWLSGYSISHFSKRPKTEKPAESFLILTAPLVAAVSIQYLSYKTVAPTYSSFSQYILNLFDNTLFSGKWGGITAYARLEKVLSSGNSGFGGIIALIMLIFALLYFPASRKSNVHILSIVFGLIAAVVVNEAAAPLWQVIIFSLFVVVSIVFSELSGWFRFRTIAISGLSLLVIFNIAVIDAQRTPLLKKYAPLRELTVRWNDNTIKFPSLYQADPMMQIIGFVSSQIEPNAWLLADGPKAYRACRVIARKTGIMPHFGRTDSYLVKKGRLSKLSTLLYRSDLTPRMLSNLLFKNVPVYFLTDKIGQVKSEGRRLNLKFNLYLDVGFGGFEVFRLADNKT